MYNKPCNIITGSYLWLSFKDTLCRFPPPEHVQVALYRPSFCTQLQVTTLSNNSYFSALHLYMEGTKCIVSAESPDHSGRKFEFQHESKGLTFSNTRKAIISDTNAGGIAFLHSFMMTSPNGNFFRVTGPLCGEFTGPGEFPTQRPVTRSFDVFFDLRLNRRLSKQPWGWWFETPSWPLWRQRNVPASVTFVVECMANKKHMEWIVILSKVAYLANWLPHISCRFCDIGVVCRPAKEFTKKCEAINLIRKLWLDFC